MTILERSACVMRAPGGAGVASLPRWAHAPHHERALTQASLPDDGVNNRLVIWHGDISLLDADVITNWTDSTLTECNSVSERILDKAGADLKEHVVNRGYECRPDEVVVTGGYSLRCRHIVHVVYPKLTDSEATLMNCYNRALNAGMALGARSLALCAVPGHSPELAADIALRAVRLYLDRNRSSLVILVGLRASDAALLAALAPAHFPHGPAGGGGALGRDHRIRIIHNPHEHDHHTAEDDTSIYEEESAAALARALAPDTQRLLAPTPRRATLDNLHHDQYERLLRRAHTEDLSSVSGIGCLYQSGVDRLGRPVVIFIGKWFPITDIDLDKALLYLIKLLDPIVRGDYVIAYFHTLASSNNHPPFSWLKEVYTVLPYKYKKNLKAFYIVHPTFWTKMMTWWFTTFMAPAIKAKVHNLPGVEYLYSVMPHDQLEVPAFVTEYDMTINGIHYFQPDST